MQIIGKTIRQVLKDRTCGQVQNEDRPEISSSQRRKQS
jgi:hypothetical protein